MQTESASRALLQVTAKDCAALYPGRKGAGRAAYQRCLQRVEAILKCDFASYRSICSGQQDRNTDLRRFSALQLPWRDGGSAFYAFVPSPVVPSYGWN